MSLRSLLATTLVVLLLTGVLAGTTEDPGGPLRIGVVAPLTGPRSYLGEEIVNGARLAVDELNEGLARPAVELVVVDDADLVQLPTQLARLANRDRVAAVVGPEAPGPVLSDRSPLRRRDVPVLLSAAFAGDLSAAPTTVVRTVPSARAQAGALGRWLSSVRRAEQVAVLVADPVEGASVSDELVAGLAAGGVGGVEIAAVPGDTPRLEPALRALRERMPDAGAVLLWGPPPVAARATLAVRRIGWDVQVAVPASAFVAEYRSLARDATEGVVFPFPFRERWFRGTELMTWLLRYHREHGLGALPQLETLVLDVPVVAAASYDAVMLAVAAARSAGTTVPADVGDALVELEHEGLLRTYWELGDREVWGVDELYVARFHHLATTFDVDPRLDAEFQRQVWASQVSADYLPEDLLEGPAGALLRSLLQRSGPPPTYEPPSPPPGPVARP